MRRAFPDVSSRYGAPTGRAPSTQEEHLTMSERLYHVVRVNDSTGFKINMTSRPVTHTEAMTIISKIPTWAQFPQIRTLIVEVR